MKKRGVIASFLVRLKFAAQMAFSGITSNLLRTFLTVLGISIGVAAVVSLMGIGEGARRSIVSQFESLGQNVIIIKSNSPTITFTTTEADELSNRITGVEYSTPVVNTDAPIRWRRSDGKIELLGVNNEYPKIRDHEVISGNFFTSLHIKQRAPVAVLGFNVARSLLNGRSPVGQIIKIDGINYRIVGVMAAKGEGNGDGIDNKIIIPYSSALKITGDKEVSEIWAKSDSAEDANLAMVQLGRIYNKKIGKGSNILPNNQNGDSGQGSEEDGMMDGSSDGAIDEPMPVDDYVSDDSETTDDGSGTGADNNQDIFAKEENPLTITSLNQLVKEADQANRIMTVLLGGIAAVSLLVGGIGIMNIMLVAVTERTSEIGVRRALGAKQEDLLIQFLLEAIYVSIIGCAVGIALGAWAVKVVSSYGLDAVIDIKSIKIAIGVALSSGLLFGVYPAINASSLPPVEALKRS